MNAPPGLVCLNLQQDFIQPGTHWVPGAHGVLANAHAVLGWARRLGLPILHVLSTHRTPAHGARPIRGFESSSSEALAFKKSASIFDNEDVARLLARGEGAFVLGFTGHEDCMASAFDAQRRDVPLAFVVDAIASPALGAFSAETINGVVAAVLGELAAKITTAELLAREGAAFMPKRLEPSHERRGAT